MKVMDRARMAEALAGCGFFEGLEQGDLAEVAKLCRHRELGAGEAVFRQGEVGEHLYVVCEGKVCLERTKDLGGRDGFVVLGVLGRGNAFGSWATLLGEEHTLMSTAVCQSPTKLIAIHGPELREVMRAHRAFGFAVLERLCFLLRGRLLNVISAMERL